MHNTACFRAARCALPLIVLAGACSDGPVSPATTPEMGALTTLYECTVDVAAQSTGCRLSSISGMADGPRLDLILASPYISVVSSGTASSRGDPANEDTTTTNLTVTNNIPQPIGTADGTTAHALGTRLFFVSGPTVTTVNSGTIAGSSVRLDNPEGVATFTSAHGATYVSRAFFQYDGILAAGGVSAPELVRFVFSSNVKTFSYGLRVSASAQYEHGWVTVTPATLPIMSPGATTTLTGTVYDQVGRVQADGITWSSSNVSVATVNASTGEVAALGAGTAVITATSTVNAQREGTREVTVAFGGDL